MGMTAICLMMKNRLNIMIKALQQNVQYEISMKIGQADSEKTFKDYEIVYSPEARDKGR